MCLSVFHGQVKYVTDRSKQKISHFEINIFMKPNIFYKLNCKKPVQPVRDVRKPLSSLFTLHFNSISYSIYRKNVNI